MNFPKGRRLVVMGLMALANLQSVEGVTIRDDQPDADYLALGALADFAAVGTFVGSGFTGTGLTGYNVALGSQKRAFQNMIDGHFNLPLRVYAADFDSPHATNASGFGSVYPLLLEGCVTPGDSGGGVFIQEGSQYYLAGVISTVAYLDGSGNGSYSDASGFGRISAAMPWINSTIAVPEPSTFALLVGAGAVMLVFGRKSN